MQKRFFRLGLLSAGHAFDSVSLIDNKMFLATFYLTTKIVLNSRKSVIFIQKGTPNESETSFIELCCNWDILYVCTLVHSLWTILYSFSLIYNETIWILCLIFSWISFCRYIAVQFPAELEQAKLIPGCLLKVNFSDSTTKLYTLYNDFTQLCIQFSI